MGVSLVGIALTLVLMPAFYVARAVAEIVRGALRDFAEDGSPEIEMHKSGRSTLRRSIRKQQDRASKKPETIDPREKSASSRREAAPRTRRSSRASEEEEEGDAIKLTTNPILAQPDATGQTAGVDPPPSKPRPNLASVARAVRLAAALAPTSDSPDGPATSMVTNAEGLGSSGTGANPSEEGEHVPDSSTQHWAQLRRQLALNKLK